MALFRRFFYKKPPDKLIEIFERVYVFDCCFSSDGLGEKEYEGYLNGIVAQLQDYYPDASFMVFNFREGDRRSELSDIMSRYDMTVMEYPRQVEGCQLLPLEMIHHFLRSSESWLSLEGHQNVLLMHCEKGGWPVLAFMLAGLLLYRKQYTGEQKTLDMVYKQSPRELLHLLTPMNSQPSQIRYLRYISSRSFGSEWPPSDTMPLVLDSIKITFFPLFDGWKGIRPIVRIYGLDPSCSTVNSSSTLLFSSFKTKKHARLYRQKECELVKIGICSRVQGDVILELIHLNDDLVSEQVIFRTMFHTAFVKSHVLMLNRDEIDALWDGKDQFPKEFRAEVLFSDGDSIPSITSTEVPSEDENDAENAFTEEFFEVEEIFNNAVDGIDGKMDAGLQKSLENELRGSFRFEDCASDIRVDDGLLGTESKTSAEDGNLDSDINEAESDSRSTDTESSYQKLQVNSLRQKSDKHNPPVSKKQPTATAKPAVDPGFTKPKLRQQEGKSFPARHAKANTVKSWIPSNKGSYNNSMHVSYPQSSKYIPPPPPPHLVAVGNDSQLGVKPKASIVAANVSGVVASNFGSKPKYQTMKTTYSSSPISNPQSTSSVPDQSDFLPPPPPPLPCFNPTPTSLKSISPSPLPIPPSLPELVPGLSPQVMFPEKTKGVSSSSPMDSLAMPLVSSSPTHVPHGHLCPTSPPSSSISSIPSLRKPLLSTDSHAPPSPALPSPFPPPSHILSSSPPPILPPPPPLPPAQSQFAPAPPPPSPPSCLGAPVSLGCSLPLLPNLNGDSPQPTIMSSLHGPRQPPQPHPSELCSGPPPPPPPPMHGAQSRISRAPLPPPPPRSGPPLPPLSSIRGPSLSLPPSPPLSNGASGPPPPPLRPPRPHGSGSSPPPPSGFKEPATRDAPTPPTPMERARSLPHPLAPSAAARRSNLKPLHWSKLTRALQGSLWEELQIHGEPQIAQEFDVSELETLFSATIQTSESFGSKSGSRRKSAGSKSDKVHLVELRRANNTEIMLTRVKMPLPDMMAAVLTMDDSVLDADQVENLIKFCPTKEEMDLLKDYTGDTETLGKCEQFFLELMKVPRVESKLRVFLFKIQFNSQISDFKKSLNLVNSACQEVRNSLKLKEIMKKILYLGNALNQGTARGSAIGFKLDSLLKLTDTRASNNKMTLMHYLCKVLATKSPALLDFCVDLSSLETASKIQLKSLAEEMQAIIQGLEKVMNELSASENDGPVSEVFRKTFGLLGKILYTIELQGH